MAVTPNGIVYMAETDSGDVAYFSGQTATTADALIQSTTGPWNGIAPTLTAATTNPTLGAGGGTGGAWVKINKTVIGWGFIGFGTSGVNAGSGLYAVSLPVASFNGTPLHGTFRAKCNGLYTRGDLVLATATTCDMVYVNAAVNGALVFTSNAAPGAWAANDSIYYNYAYQAA